MYKVNQLVMHNGNICEITNIFFNNDNKRCCDLDLLDGSCVTVYVSDIYPYLGSLSLIYFRRNKKSNKFKNKIYINLLLLVLTIVSISIVSYYELIKF